jgi:hypothetical protein
LMGLSRCVGGAMASAGSRGRAVWVKDLGEPPLNESLPVARQFMPLSLV